jgi:lysophospholipase L1-like esterase
MRVSVLGIVGRATLAVVSALIASLLLDRVLFLLGYPSQPPIRYSHPADLTERRKNIEFEYQFSTNSHGLRSDDLQLAKPAGTWRVFVVGDSFTEGFGVEAADRFTDRLEGAFRQDGHPVSFINGGLSGTGPLEYARMFRQVGLKYHVDALLIVLSANDLADTVPTATPRDITSQTPVDLYPDAAPPVWRRALSRLWPRAVAQFGLWQMSRAYRERTQPRDFVTAVADAGARAGIARDQIERWKASLPERLVDAANRGTFNGGILSSALLYPTLWTDSLDIDTPLAERKWRAMASILTAMVNAARRHSLQVGVVFVPTRFQYDLASHGVANPWIRAGAVVRGAWLSGHTEVERRLEGWAEGLDVPFLDLTDSLRAAARTQRDLYWPLDGHWTPAGHHVASIAIYQWITSQHVFAFLP